VAKKKPAEATKNAAAAVRAYLTAHPRANDNEIRKALAEMAINLVPNYVSVIRLQMMAERPGRRRTRARMPGRSARARRPTKQVARLARRPRRAAPNDLDLDRLTAAADFAQLCGGTANAIEALESAQSIYETMREAE